ncbi:beta-class carbonic anhydrase [Inediibacterium massiliense]|uniref:beta-class carbonic anhydrase n=1 Tax=Inediibacterium massiliense TaxID=1658111 RepID=UPI0006B5C589|nr:carbonic anhydrase [Inediibacterium massiliense]
MIEKILDFNRTFVSEKKYETYRTSKYPNKKVAIVTCMDTRLIELLPAALGLKNGDAKIIKNAGGIISHPFGSAVRSLLVAIYELNVNEIIVIGHTDCGVQHMDSEKILDHMKRRGIPSERIELARDFGVNVDAWLRGFEDVNTSVKNSVALLRRHPLIPDDVCIYGYIMDSVTGELTSVSE